jgi:hypothetical protein
MRKAGGKTHRRAVPALTRLSFPFPLPRLPFNTSCASTVFPTLLFKSSLNLSNTARISSSVSKASGGISSPETSAAVPFGWKRRAGPGPVVVGGIDEGQTRRRRGRRGRTWEGWDEDWEVTESDLRVLQGSKSW